MCTWARTGADAPNFQLVRHAAIETLDPVADLTRGRLKWSRGAFVYMEAYTNSLPPSFSTLDRDGLLISSATLRIPNAEQFWFGDYDRRPDGSGYLGRLVATRDRVGCYFSMKEGGKYVEVSTDAMMLNAFPGLPQSPSTDGTVVGFALTDAGEASLSIEDQTPRVWTTYSLDRATSQWIPLQVPSIVGYRYAPNLMGSDGENLVFQYGHSVEFLSVSH